MRIYFEDRTVQACSPTDRCLIATGRLLENPESTKGLVQVTSVPPMWARLIAVRCEVVQANHLVMTETGLKRVIKVDRGAGTT
jgi:hypothetical protein